MFFHKSHLPLFPLQNNSYKVVKLSDKVENRKAIYYNYNKYPNKQQCIKVTLFGSTTNFVVKHKFICNYFHVIL